MRVDSHQHFWQWSKGWFSRKEPVLAQDYLPVDLEPLLMTHGIDKSIVVQTSPTVAETNFVLELAEAYDFIGGVVDWLDLESPDFNEQKNLHCARVLQWICEHAGKHGDAPEKQIRTYDRA